MKTESFDLVVIGGGITGAGIARDAALRGIKTALLERVDGDTDLLRYVVELFLEELPRLMSEIRDAVAQHPVD